MSEILIAGNPKKKKRAHHGKGHHPKAHNPSKHHKGKRRRYHNPALFGRTLALPGGIDLMAAGIGAIGAIGIGFATDALAKALPVEQLKSGFGRWALRAGTILGGGLVGAMFLPRPLIRSAMTGAATVLVIDGVRLLVPDLPGIGDDDLVELTPQELQRLSGYVTTQPALSGYVRGGVNGAAMPLFARA